VQGYGPGTERRVLSNPRKALRAERKARLLRIATALGCTVKEARLKGNQALYNAALPTLKRLGSLARCPQCAGSGIFAPSVACSLCYGTGTRQP